MRYGKTFLIITVAALIANVVVGIVSYNVWGIDSVGENLVWGLGLTTLVEILVVGLFWIYWRFIEIPEEIYNEQIETISSRQPSQLNIFVGDSPYSKYVAGSRTPHRRIALTVISQETRKLTDLHAVRLELLQRTADMPADISGARIESSDGNFRFLWETGDPFTGLLPGEQTELIVAELSDLLKSVPVFGEPKAHSFTRGNQESIYEVHIQFRAKRDGEADYAYKNFMGEIFCDPDNNLLEFISEPEDVPESLRPKVFYAGKEGQYA